MLKNIGWMTISTFLRLGAGFVLFIFLARELGPENFGLLAYWLAFSGLLGLLVNYGFGLQLLRELGQNPAMASGIFSKTLAAKLVLGLVAICVGFVIGIQREGRPDVFWPLLGMVLAESFAEHLNFVLRGLGYFDKEARIALITASINFLGVLVPLFVYKTVGAVAIGFLVTRVISLIINWWMSVKILPAICRRPDLSWMAVRTTLFGGFPYAADMAVSTLNSTLDVLLLTHLSGTKAVGLYQAGLKLMQGANSIAPIIGNVYTPHIASTQTRREDCESVAKALMLKMSVLGGAIGAVLALGNQFITKLLFGAEYGALSALLPWFGLALALRLVAAGFGINLTAHGFQTARVVTNGVAVFLLIVTAIVTVPRFGAAGMLMAFVASVLLVGSTYCAALYRKGIPTGLNPLNLGVIGGFIVPILFRIMDTN